MGIFFPATVGEGRNLEFGRELNPKSLATLSQAMHR